MTEVRQGLFDLSDAITQLHLLIILHVELLFRDARRVLEKTFGEGVVLTLNPLIFSPADRDVERAWPDTRCVSLLQLLVG